MNIETSTGREGMENEICESSGGVDQFGKLGADVDDDGRSPKRTGI